RRRSHAAPICVPPFTRPRHTCPGLWPAGRRGGSAAGMDRSTISVGPGTTAAISPWLPAGGGSRRGRGGAGAPEHHPKGVPMTVQPPNQLPNTTTDAGAPVSSDEYSLTVGPGGPNLLQDAYLIEKLAHFVRERVPDRVYHVKGGGAFGYFEVTADVTQWT